MALAASLSWAVAADASAGPQPAQTLLHVTAVVQRHAAIRLNAPQSLTISEADVQRGYVDVQAPVEVIVRSNVPEGYVLALENHGEQVRETQVHGFAAPLVVGAAGGSFTTRPATGRGVWTDRLALHLRFRLSPSARPGTHPWPLLVSMAQ